MAIVTNSPNVSKARARSTSVDPPVPESVMSSQLNIASTAAATAAAAITTAYVPRGHGGGSAPTSRSSGATPQGTISGERANQGTWGPWKVACASSLLGAPAPDATRSI